MTNLDRLGKGVRPPTHRELYPDQYTHELVGRYVRVETQGTVRVQGTVERVVSTRFGLLAIIEGDKPGQAWAVKNCKRTAFQQRVEP